MRLSTRFGLIAIGALALLTTVHYLRDLTLPPQPFRDYLLGVLPNFAAAIAITFVPLSAWSDRKREADSVARQRAFLVCAAFSGVGLVAWEMFQIGRRAFVFDLHDLGATGVGLGCAALVFRDLTRRLRSQGRG